MGIFKEIRLTPLQWQALQEVVLPPYTQLSKRYSPGINVEQYKGEGGHVCTLATVKLKGRKDRKFFIFESGRIAPHSGNPKQRRLPPGKKSWGEA